MGSYLGVELNGMIFQERKSWVYIFRNAAHLQTLLYKGDLLEYLIRTTEAGRRSIWDGDGDGV